MNKLEELLIITSEECAELTVACSKILRFGDLNENTENLKKELSDAKAMINLVQEYFKWNDEEIKKGIESKYQKLKIFSRLFEND